MRTRSTTGVEESPLRHLGSSSAASGRSREPIRVLVISPDEAAGLVSKALDVEGLLLLKPVSVLEELDVSGDEIPDALVLHDPDPGSDLVAQVRTLRDALPGARIVVVAKSTSLRQLRVLIGEGVDALVLESDVGRCLWLAVRSACEGLVSFPESLRGTLARPVLSSREKQVLGLVVLGLTNAEIARKLVILRI